MRGDQLLQHLGGATPVSVNFAISGIDRVVRDTKTALARRRAGRIGGTSLRRAGNLERTEGRRHCDAVVLGSSARGSWSADIGDGENFVWCTSLRAISASSEVGLNNFLYATAPDCGRYASQEYIA
jgi:hypothetical protein